VNVLALTKYERKGASSRLRFEQFKESLTAAGCDVTFRSVFRDRYLELLYQSGARPKSEVLRGFINRLSDAPHIGKYDAVWLEGELFPWLPTCMELSFLRRARWLVVDYDDPIHLKYAGSALPWSQKIEAIMQVADVVVAANPVLVAHAETAGAKHVEFIPTVVDCEKFDTDGGRQQGAPTVVGWIGTPQTAPYLTAIAPVLEKLQREGLIEVHVVGDSDAAAVQGCHHIPWQEDTEAAVVDEFDIGIMPLTDDPWSRGKSGFKLVQYMAARKAVIASPVGFNVDLVNRSGAGFLASSLAEWEAAIRTLTSSRGLQQYLGQRGREYVERHFSVQAIAPRLVRIFSELQPRAP
jgi:glycosyltransferase involved in cell wall biosynthesis